MAFADTGFERARRRAWGLVSPNMSPGMFFLDFAAYPLAIALCLFLAFDGGGPGRRLESAGLALSGLAAWTLAEYLIHRFVLHAVPGFAGVHMAHHGAPRELVGTPTVFSLAAFYAFAFWPIAHFAGAQAAGAFVAGLLGGYLAYAAAHYAVHHLGSGGYGLMQALKRQHALHHHGDSGRNFGVTTGFWDRVFGTFEGK
jgi:sterol desaturase/sphingolipid hydroxylase (fatty acid hydroxylase superfamily)